MKTLSLIFCLFLSQFVFSQDLIYLLNGGILEGNVKGTEDGLIYYEVQKGKKTKLKSADLSRVFSVIKTNGEEEIYYEKDLESGFFFDEQQMKHFVFGAQDAVQYYHGNFHLLTAAAAGAVGGFLLYDSFLVIAAPFGATLVGSLGKAHPNKSMVRDSKYLNDPAYVLGFERTANSRKVMRALLGAFVGTAVGVGVGVGTKWKE